jgi:hypothetical protein
MGFYRVLVALPLISSVLPVRLTAGLTGFYGVILRVFQNNNRASTWLAFALVWLICATTALASTTLVYCVARTRKRIFDR